MATLNADRYVLGFEQIDRTQISVVGGKGAHLGELSRIDGIRVPAGFCVTTDAFQRIVADAPSIDDQLDRLARLKPDDRTRSARSAPRSAGTIEAIVIPDDLAAAIAAAIAQLGERSRLRGEIERDGRRPADGIVRRAAGHVSERRGPGGDPPTRQPVLGVALHRAGRDLPLAERLRPPACPHGHGRAAMVFPRRRRRPVHRRPRLVESQDRRPWRPPSASGRRWSRVW